jgi:hypothetical protein
VRTTSFFNSTAISFPTNVLKNEKKSMVIYCNRWCGEVRELMVVIWSSICNSTRVSTDAIGTETQEGAKFIFRSTQMDVMMICAL